MAHKAEFKDSHVHGDAVLGDKLQYPEILSPLEKVIQAIRQNVKDDSNLKEAINELAEYISDRPDRLLRLT